MTSARGVPLAKQGRGEFPAAGRPLSFPIKAEPARHSRNLWPGNISVSAPSHGSWDGQQLADAKSGGSSSLAPGRGRELAGLRRPAKLAGARRARCLGLVGARGAGLPLNRGGSRLGRQGGAGNMGVCEKVWGGCGVLLLIPRRALVVVVPSAYFTFHHPYPPPRNPLLKLYGIGTNRCSPNHDCPPTSDRGRSAPVIPTPVHRSSWLTPPCFALPL